MLHQLALAHLNDALIDRIGVGDDVLLQYGTVWALLNGHADNGKLLALQSKSCQLYALKAALQVNGIEPERIIAGVQLIDYAEWVALTVKNPVIHTWN